MKLKMRMMASKIETPQPENLFFVKMVKYILKITFWENIRKILKFTSSQIMEVVANETLMSLTVV